MKPSHFASGVALFITTLVGTPLVALIGNPSVFALADASQSPTDFRVRIENITSADAFIASNGVKWSLGFSPGIWTLNTIKNPLFTPGERDRSQGLEAQSEDGKPDRLAASLQKQSGIDRIGIFNTPVGQPQPGPIRPGNAYEFKVSAVPGEQVSLTLMFGQSNDWFYSTDGGIALFDRQGNPISGDVTDQITLWDAGTELDQEPGIGSDQGPRQKSDNTGVAEQVGVNPIVFEYPAKSVMRVTITPNP